MDVRLDKFKEKAVPLVSDVARRAIKEAGLNVSDISKLVVVSSTGFLGPGLDCELIKNLGLTRSVDRTLIGFMGCAAAMNGFRNANDYVTVSFFRLILLCFLVFLRISFVCSMLCLCCEWVRISPFRCYVTISDLLLGCCLCFHLSRGRLHRRRSALWLTP